jgi:hypothetical protein
MKNMGLYIIFCLILWSCNKPGSPDCFKQAGAFAVKERNLGGPVREIVVQSPLYVSVRYAPFEKIEIKGPENLIEKISFHHVNKALYIKNNNKCNFVRGYKHNVYVYIYTPHLEFVRNNAVGEIRVESSVITDTLRIETEAGDIIVDCDMYKLSGSSHGNGNIYFYGTAQKAYFYIFGTCFLYAADGIINGYAYVEHVSVGDAYLNLTDGSLLNYKIYKKGNIFYKGSIIMDGNRYGSGNLKKF